ncbi:MAG: ParB/RepB/Spo0J family partition protein [Desulfatitalea sp.]
MEFDYRPVSLSRIDDGDATYRITAGSSLEAIRHSIEQIGLINPPTLLPCNDRFIVIAGFGRIAACRALGWERLVARCPTSPADAVRYALTAIADNATQRTLNLVEVARAWHLLTRTVDSQEQAMQLARSVGMTVNKELSAKLKQVLGMPHPLQQALIDGSIALPIALRLNALADGAAIHALVLLFQELQLSLNRQRELLEWSQGIMGREGISLKDVIDDERLAQWRQDPQMDRGQKTQLIRQHLKKRRYPEISAFEERYHRSVKELKLVEGMQLVPPAHFEGQKYGLHLEFKNPTELDRLCLEVQRLAGSPTLLKLVDPNK